MAAARTSAALEIRKLRKKLRQIENLERIDRELTDDEYYKIDKKDKIRESLLRLLATQNEDESEDSITASTRSEFSGQGHNTSSIATDDFSASYSEADIGNVEVTVIEHEDEDNFEQIDVEEIEEQVENIGKNGGDMVTVESKDTSLRSTEISTSPKSVSGTSDSQTKVKSVSGTSDSQTKVKSVSSISESPTKAKSSGSPSKKKSKKNDQNDKDCAKLKAVVQKWRQCRFGVVEMEGHSDLITDVCADGKFLVSASRDTTLKLWDLDSLTEIHSYGGHTGTVTSVIILSRDDSLKVCESIDVDVGERIVISSSLDCSFKVWSTGLDVIIPPCTVIRGGQSLRSVYTYNPVTKVAFHSSAGAVITGSDGGKVELWNAKNGENMESSRQFDSAVTGLKLWLRAEKETLYVMGELKFSAGYPLRKRVHHIMNLYTCTNRKP
ncbi:mitochondrial division protein 1-like [Pecten maximus]|uniref:mitochondrial division protein 1-like n=1 Tax=Pecten maximus TaxID=6579 RepID=UPI001458A348|nr:mitochondrial division protein 1-like [Pecten maximus]